MFDLLIKPINVPEMIRMQAQSRVEYVDQKAINRLGSKEKAYLNNVHVKTISKRFPVRYTTHRHK